jgi:hypothetical protein
MKCPVCGCQDFFVKNPEDEFEVYPFDVKDGKVRFDAEVDASQAPAVSERTETFCDKCAWHGPLTEMEK